MPDPDKSSSSSSYTYGSTFAFGIFVALVIIVLYGQYNSMKGYFSFVLWGILPLTIFIMGVGLNLIGQKIACNKVDVGSAFSATLYLPLWVYFFLGISQISYVRAPVTSLFVQLPDVTVLQAEKERPTLKGIAVAYYVFFGILFGQIFSSGLSQAC